MVYRRLTRVFVKKKHAVEVESTYVEWLQDKMTIEGKTKTIDCTNQIYQSQSVYCYGQVLSNSSYKSGAWKMRTLNDFASDRLARHLRNILRV
jgi:hypothetical protein